MKRRQFLSYLGHSLGLLGLIIAFFGVLGEFYQILSIEKLYYGIFLFGLLVISTTIIFFFTKKYAD